MLALLPATITLVALNSACNIPRVQQQQQLQLQPRSPQIKPQEQQPKKLVKVKKVKSKQKQNTVKAETYRKLDVD